VILRWRCSNVIDVQCLAACHLSLARRTILEGQRLGAMVSAGGVSNPRDQQTGMLFAIVVGNIYWIICCFYGKTILGNRKDGNFASRLPKAAIMHLKVGFTKDHKA
jgi:hypothetical protein